MPEVYPHASGEAMSFSPADPPAGIETALDAKRYGAKRGASVVTIP